MKYQRLFRLRVLLFSIALCSGPISSAALGQERPQNPPPSAQSDEVLRVNTDLVQTSVVVLDKEGRFVDNLQREQFELHVDGKTQPIAFFESVMTGSADEAAKLAAARNRKVAPTPEKTTPPAIERGRAALFFIDDWHLTPESLHRTRQLLLKYINEQMGPTDQMLIVSASGQLGFLQQLTDNKDVLRQAVERLKYQTQSKLDTDLRPMTVYQARAIERNDQDVLKYKINEWMVDMFIPPQKIAVYYPIAEAQMRNKARMIVQQSEIINRGLFTALEQLARASAALPGRKILFYLSDGFVVNIRGSEATERLRRITDMAVRSGLVFYTIDVRGLFTAFADASTSVANDRYTGHNISYDALASNEAIATQEPLRILAADTGGRAILNTNNIETGITKALQETSRYYLLAWQPERNEQEKPKFHQVEVTIKGRPDLTVIVPRGFSDTPSQPAAGVSSGQISSTSSPNADLNAALNSPFIHGELPVSLYALFTSDAGNNSLVTASVELSASDLAPNQATNDAKSEVDVACVVLNEQGKPVFSSGRTVTITQNAANHPGSSQSKIMTNFSIPLAKGFYQVRVAARDSRTGRLGSSYQWVDVPELRPGHMSLSTLLIGERRMEASTGEAGQPAQVSQSTSPGLILNVERRFDRSSHLFLQLYIYNAALSAATGKPDIMMEIQVLRRNQVILSAPSHQVSLAGNTDPQRVRYGAEIPLQRIPAGPYTLKVTATDRTAKITATQQINFVVQ